MLDNDFHGNYYTKNGIYKDKYLGQCTSNNALEFITSLGIGTARSDVYLGANFDIIDGVYNKKWMIVAFGYDSTINGNKLYITLMPRQYAFTLPMNSTNTTGVSQNELNPLYNDRTDPETGEIIPGTHGVETRGKQGYYGSDMYQIHLPEIANNLSSILGDHLLDNKYLISDTINLNPQDLNITKTVTNVAWRSAKAILPTEIQLHGAPVYSIYNDTGNDCSRLPIFNFVPNPQVLLGAGYTWERNVATPSKFCTTDSHVGAFYKDASDEIRATPLICII